jgi:hypothetical protein
VTVTTTDDTPGAGTVEDALYAIRDVVVARVIERPGERAEIALLVRPDADVAEVTRLAGDAIAGCPGARDASLQVVALDGAGDPAPAAPFEDQAILPRTRLRRVSTTTDGDVLRAEVTLSGTHDAIGVAESRSGPVGWPMAVAEATLMGLLRLHPTVDAAFVVAAEVTELGGRRLAIAVVEVRRGGREEHLLGAAALRAHDVAGGVARAVLDATNRRMPLVP